MAPRQLSQPESNGNFQSNPTPSQLAAAAVGQELGRVASEYLRRNLDVRPTIEVRPLEVRPPLPPYAVGLCARKRRLGHPPVAAFFELAAGPGLLLRVPVSELEVVHLRPGDSATVRVDALPDVSLSARIARIFPSAEGATRQVTVELSLAEPPAAVRPGFLARARMVLERRKGALLVPEAAMQRGSEVPHFVWVLDGDTARVRPVEPGERVDGRVVIRSGLAAGEEVVVEGLVRLRDGGPVRRATGKAGP